MIDDDNNDNKDDCCQFVDDLTKLLLTALNGS